MFVRIRTISPTRAVMINLSSIEAIVHDPQIRYYTIHLGCGKEIVVNERDIRVVIDNLEFIGGK